MRVITCLILLATSFTRLSGSQRIEAIDYYNETVDLIFNNIEYCDHNCEDHSHAYQIADRVFHIVYEISDDKISKEKKFDLLSMMALFHGHATIAYRHHSILHRLNSNSTDDIKTEIINHPEFCIPIMGYKHSIEHFSFIDLDSITCCKQSLFPVSYAPYINDLISFIKYRNREITLEELEEFGRKFVEDLKGGNVNKAKGETIVREKYRYVLRNIVQERGLNINKGAAIELEHSCFMSQ